VTVGAYSDPSLYERRELPEEFWNLTLEAIIDAFGILTAADFGCGLGVDVQMMIESGLDVYGVDGTEELRESVLFAPERYIVRDLTLPIKLPVDLVWCREVAEHIPEEYAERLVDNVSTNAKQAIYFTAAPPGQVGYQHVNLKPQSYWLTMFFARGWKLAKAITQFNAKENPHPDDRENGVVLWRP
jgi:2-polyprenyl-3-methyl-5-hydroxy-6-metoxy-1,4-benzoquinol methylase